MNDVIEQVMTPAEIESTFDLSAGTVRQYLRTHSDKMVAAKEARKADGRTWLITKEAANRIWGNN
jgi:hypothetical protein